MSSLFVDRRNTQLELESGAIVFRENGARIGTVPIAPLSRVFLRGDVQLCANLLGKLGERGVGVVILSGRYGKPSLLLARPHNDASRRVAQIRKSLDPEFCLAYARQLIRDKLQQQMAWFDELRAQDMHARYELTHAMNLLKDHNARLPGAKNLASLRGIEGSAAHCYFDGLKALVPAGLHFNSRNRRPPRDPFNALLSLTYTLLHSEAAIAIYGAGLDPYVGFYHQLDYGRESLASDLLEPMRPLADQFCLRLIKEQTLTADHFSTTEAQCLLGKAGRARYYAAYEAQSETLRRSLNAQVENTAQAIGCSTQATPADSQEWGEE